VTDSPRGPSQDPAELAISQAFLVAAVGGSHHQLQHPLDQVARLLVAGIATAVRERRLSSLTELDDDTGEFGDEERQRDAMARGQRDGLPELSPPARHTTVAAPLGLGDTERANQPSMRSTAAATTGAKRPGLVTRP